MVQRSGGRLFRSWLRAGQQNNSIEIFHLTAFDFAIFFVDNFVVNFVVNFVENGAVNRGPGKQFTDGGSTGAAVRQADYHLGIKAVLTRPALPHSRNCRSGVDEHAVEIEE